MISMYVIIGNILGGLSSVFLGISVHKRNKNGMVKYQIIDCICAILSCVFLKGYNGVVSNSIALIRNIIEYKGKVTKKFAYSLVFVTLLFGVYNFLSNEKVWYSLFPIIASIEYTLILTLCKSYNKCKLSLIVNLSLWLIYNLFILNFVSAITNAVLIINTIYTLNMANQKFADNGLTKFQREKLKYEWHHNKERVK